MKVLLDEMLPPQLKDLLKEHQVSTVQEMGWGGIKNGELLRQASGNFEVFLTADKNLRYQQNLKQFDLGIIVLTSNRIEIILSLTQRLNGALRGIAPGTLLEL